MTNVTTNSKFLIAVLVFVCISGVVGLAALIYTTLTSKRAEQLMNAASFAFARNSQLGNDNLQSIELFYDENWFARSSRETRENYFTLRGGELTCVKPGNYVVYFYFTQTGGGGVTINITRNQSNAVIARSQSALQTSPVLRYSDQCTFAGSFGTDETIQTGFMFSPTRPNELVSHFIIVPSFDE